MSEHISSSNLVKVLLFSVAGLLAILVFRIVYSVPIEFNDESILKWQLASQFLASGDWELFQGDHHNLRWSVIAPQMVAVGLFSDSWFSYYIAPISFWAVFGIACSGFFCSQRHSATLSATLLVVIALEPLGHAMASQVNSGAFGLLYVVCGIYAALAYVRSNRWIYLFLTALAFFFAYGAHLTFVVFAGAPVVFLLVNRVDYRGLVVYLLSFAALLGLESFVLSAISGGAIEGGRLVEVAKLKTWGSIDEITGIDNRAMGSTRWKGAEPYAMHHFFDRWWMLPKYSLMIGIVFILSSGALLSSRFRRELPHGVWLCFYAAGIYGLAVSAPIIGFNPLRLVLDLHSRYLAPFFPLAAVYVVWVLGTISQNYCGKRAGIFVGSIAALAFTSFAIGSYTYRCTEEILSTTRLGSDLSVENFYCRAFRYTQEQVIYPSPDTFALRADQYYTSFSDDYVSGKVALYGYTRIGAFRQFIQVHYPHAQFLETPNGWFSIDGKDKSMCVKELGQTLQVQENYHPCSGLIMKPGILEGNLKTGTLENG